MVGTPQVGALGSKCNDLFVRQLDDPGGNFFADDFPAIDAVPAEHNLLGSLQFKLGQAASALLAKPKWWRWRTKPRK
jgi:hypothetical protein